jgi:hypothetical protein
VPIHGRAPASPLKTKNTRLPTEGRKAIKYYSVGGTRRPASQSAQRPNVPTVPDSWRAPAPPSKSKNARFPTEGRKAVTFYTVDRTRKPASTKCTEAQYFPPHLPTGESSLPYLRGNISSVPLSEKNCWSSRRETLKFPNTGA